MTAAVVAPDITGEAQLRAEAEKRAADRLPPVLAGAVFSELDLARDKIKSLEAEALLQSSLIRTMTKDLHQAYK